MQEFFLVFKLLIPQELILNVGCRRDHILFLSCGSLFLDPFTHLSLLSPTLDTVQLKPTGSLFLLFLLSMVMLATVLLGPSCGTRTWTLRTWPHLIWVMAGLVLGECCTEWVQRKPDLHSGTGHCIPPSELPLFKVLQNEDLKRCPPTAWHLDKVWNQARKAFCMGSWTPNDKSCMS